MEKDAVDQIAEQWRALLPKLDVRAMATIGRLGRVYVLGERLIEAKLGEFGLALGDFDVLAALRRAGEPHQLTPTQLYRALMLTSGAMTNRLDRLEARKLVARLADPNDRRGTLVALTPEGLALVNGAVQAHVANEIRMLSSLSRAEQTQLDGLLRKLLLAFEREHEGAQAAGEQATPERAGPADKAFQKVRTPRSRRRR